MFILSRSILFYHHTECTYSIRKSIYRYDEQQNGHDLKRASFKAALVSRDGDIALLVGLSIFLPINWITGEMKFIGMIGENQFHWLCLRGCKSRNEHG